MNSAGVCGIFGRRLPIRGAELDCLAAENPIMAEAKRAIYELTADDKAREAVRQRDTTPSPGD